MKLVVGLGNPEERYANTRHNLGFELLDHFVAKRLPTTDYGKIWSNETKFKAEVCRLKSEDIILAKPQTFMNNSGMAVSLILNYYKIKPVDVIIIYDELDLPFGKIKVRKGGAAAGHHGVESIIEGLGTDQFIRVRLGIGNLKTESAEHGGAHIDTNHYVLEPFMHSEKSKVKHMIKQALKALDILLDEGLDVAQNQYN